MVRKDTLEELDGHTKVLIACKSCNHQIGTIKDMTVRVALKKCAVFYES